MQILQSSGLKKRKANMKHVCNKEVEITEMHSDIKYIRKALEGNGVKGICQKVDEHEKFIIEQSAVLKEQEKTFIKWMGGGIGFTILNIMMVAFQMWRGL
jgi:hypothetical protein